MTDVDLHHSPRLERIPPHSVDDEQGVLACCILNAAEAVPECVTKLPAGGVSAFYELRHQTLYGVLVDMFDRREPIDITTIVPRLRERNLLEACGGVAYVAQLPNLVPSAAQLGHHLAAVRRMFIRRQMIEFGQMAITAAYEHDGDDIDELTDDFERNALGVCQQHDDAADETPIRELIRQAINRIELYHANRGKLMGLSTGLPDLDRMTGGLTNGEMYVVAARPSVGKTSLAMNIAETVAIDQNLPVGVFSLEMSSQSLVMRMLCSRARVNLRNVSDGFLAERDFPKLTSAAGKIAASNLRVNDIAGLSIQKLRARARRMWLQHGIKLFVIDYLQLLNSSSKKAQQSRQVEVAEISGGIKQLAKDLNVPVIVLVQLNRGSETGGSKGKPRRPRMADLRESGAIEQDADFIGLLFDPALGDEDDESKTNDNDCKAVTLAVAKQRNGPVGDVHLTFMKCYTRFESAAKIEPPEPSSNGHYQAPEPEPEPEPQRSFFPD